MGHPRPQGIGLQQLTNGGDQSQTERFQVDLLLRLTAAHVARNLDFLHTTFHRFRRGLPPRELRWVMRDGIREQNTRRGGPK